MSDLIGLAEIREARRTLPGLIRKTPIVAVERGPDGPGPGSFFLKLENLQVTGSYKPRAAFHVLGSLSPEERERGVVLPSSGNFGRAFALAGREAGVAVVVVSSEGVTATKVRGMERYGAEVIVGESYADRFRIVGEVARERGMTEIATVSDPRVPAGHGTLGLEILDQHPDLRTVVVPVSSGCLIAGVAAAVKGRSPGVRVVGAQPERRPAMYESLRAGQPVEVASRSSLADCLTATSVDPLPFAHAREWVDEVVLVSEREIAEAVRFLVFEGKVVAEPGGAVATAAVLGGTAGEATDTVAIVSGGNVEPGVLGSLVTGGGAGG